MGASVSQLLNQALSCQVITRLAEFETMGDEWADLMQRAGVSNINLDHPWLVAWLTHFPPKQLFILAVRNEEGLLVAAAPFKIDPGKLGFASRLVRHAQFIGTNPSVYDGISCLVDKALDTELAVKMMIDQLQHHRYAWDVLDFQFINDEAQSQLWAKHLKVFSINTHIPCSMPIMQLPDNLDYYLENDLDRDLKKEMRNYTNRLKRNFPDQPLNLNVALEPALLDRFFEIHHAYWAAKGSRSDFVRFPNLQAFYRNLLVLYPASSKREKQVLFSVLQVGTLPLSYQITLFDGKQFLGHLGVYDQEYKFYSPGILHYEQMVETAIDHFHAEIFSFGRGDEPYKRYWAKTSIPLFNIMACQSFWSHSLLALDEGLRWFKKKIQLSLEALRKKRAKHGKAN